jgi:hypothetical protein
VKPGKRDVQALADVLREVASLDVHEAAQRALEAAWERYEAVAKYTVVGQVKQPDNKGDKVALGWFRTRAQAMAPALSLAYSAQTHEEARAWVLPLHHGSPFDWYKARKAVQQATSDEVPWRERELRRRIEWVAEHPGEPLPPEFGVTLFDNNAEVCKTCHGTGKTVREDLYESV